ncbi:MAG: T9SS type A sorting domain-containing protein, partial [Bacteroidetes bacterium]|nr:T9SS type A sorting domain-containing protein [Bacteroidota bacterium]
GVYSVTVSDAHGCTGTSDPIGVTVHPAPQPVITAIGGTEICEGDTLMLDAGSGYAAYLWSNGGTAQRNYVSQAGSYSVTVWTDEGCEGISDPVDVAVLPAPPKPVVSRSVDMLTTEPAASWQWYSNGQELSGETNQSLQLMETGNYQVRITNEHGCTAMSDPFPVTTLDIEAPATVRDFTVFPDPNDGYVTIRFSSEIPVSVRVTVSNLLGQTITESYEAGPLTDYHRRIDLGDVQSGVYLLRVTTDESSWIRKIIRQ